MALHLYTFDDPPSERHIKQACEVLSRDGVISYQLDQNWAFGCDAANPRAIDRIRMLKPHHPKDQPFTLICSSISMASEYGNIEHHAYRMLKKAWPGPYTVLLQRSRNLARQLNDKRKVVGIRIPDSKLLAALIDAYGMPLASTSAPFVDELEPAKQGYQIEEKFGHGLDLILDLGHEVTGEESSVIDLSEGAPVLVRQGLGDVALFGL